MGSNVSSKKNNKRKKKFNFFSKGTMDISLIFVIVFLISFGVVMIYSSSYYVSFIESGNHVFYFRRQLMWSAIGLFAMFVMASIDYHFICKFSLYIYLIANVLLGIVLVFTDPVKGAKRWIDLGFVSFQPSEIAKLAIIITLAVSISSTRKVLNKWRVYFFNLGILAIPVGLIFVSNKSTSFVALAIGIAMLFVAMPDKKSLFSFIIAPILLGVSAIIVLLLSAITNIGGILPPYVVDRIESFMEGPFADPMDKGYQSVQSLYAIGSGGIFGKGLGNSMQKNGFIPEAHNDIIFSIICEELGLFGAMAVLLLFMLLLWRCVVIASNAKDLSGMLIVSGIMAQIGIQVCINIAVVTNSMPVTGMPLPFISYGGTSLLILLVEVGIVLSVSRQSAK